MGLVKEMLLQAFLIILCAGSIVGIAVGAAMLLKPEQLAFVNQYFSRWIGSGRITEPLDRPRWTERYFYRHHRLTGSVFIIGAVFVLYTFLFSYNIRRLSAAVTSGTWVLVDALVAILIVGSVLAALVGAVVLARPSLLRELEKSANRWIATEGVAKFIDRMRFSPDQHILRHRKIAGVVLIIGGLYILIVIGPFLWQGGLKF